MVSGTDSVTELYGVGSRTASRIEGDTVREFVAGRSNINVASANAERLAWNVLTADISTFDQAPREADVMMAKLATAHKMRFEPTRQARRVRGRGTADPNSIDQFDAAYTSRNYYIYVGDMSPTDLQYYPSYSTQPNGIAPAFLRTTAGAHEAVYLITEDRGPHARPNQRLRDSDSSAAETVVPAWAVESIAAVFDAEPHEILDKMWFEQSSPLVIADDDTGFRAMVGAAVIDERSDTATSYLQTEGRGQDPSQYVLELGSIGR